MHTKDLLTTKRLRNLEEMVAEIRPEQLSEKIKAGEFVHLIDISEADEFAKKHIKDARNVSLSEIVSVVEGDFQKFQKLVVCCRESVESVGKVAVEKLQHAGFFNVELLTGDAEAWQRAGLPLEGRGKEPANEKTKE